MESEVIAQRHPWNNPLLTPVALTLPTLVTLKGHCMMQSFYVDGVRRSTEVIFSGAGWLVVLKIKNYWLFVKISVITVGMSSSLVYCTTYHMEFHTKKYEDYFLAT